MVNPLETYFIVTMMIGLLFAPSLGAYIWSTAAIDAKRFDRQPFDGLIVTFAVCVVVDLALLLTHAFGFIRSQNMNIALIVTLAAWVLNVTIVDWANKRVKRARQKHEDWLKSNRRAATLNY
jgi:uncharacterized membrane protein